MAKKTDAKKPKRRLGRGLQSLIGDPVKIGLPPPGDGAERSSDGGQGSGSDSSESSASPSKSTPVARSEPTQATSRNISVPAAVPAPASADAAGGQRASADPASPHGEHVIAGVGTDHAQPTEQSTNTAFGAAATDDASRNPEVAESNGTDGPGPLRLIPLASLRPNARQPRTRFDDAALASLAESIRTAGMMQPIVARPVSEPGAGAAAFEIIAGERRFRAASRLGLDRVPVIVRQIDDRTAAEWALVENLQREDLDPIERAVAFRRLGDEFEMTHAAIAEAVGLDRASVTNHLRLLSLDDAVLDLVRAGQLGMGHARSLLSIDEPSARAELANQAVRDQWSVRELERRVRAARVPQPTPASGDGAPAPASLPDASRVHLDDLERRLGEHLGTRVQIRSGRRKGTGELRVQFFSYEEFEGLLDRVGFKPDHG